MFFFPAITGRVNISIFGAIYVDTSFAIFIFNFIFIPLDISAVKLVARIFGDEHNKWAIGEVTFIFSFIEDIWDWALREVGFEDLFGGIDVGSIVAYSGVTDCL